MHPDGRPSPLKSPASGLLRCIRFSEEGPELASVDNCEPQRGVDLRCYRPSHEDHLPCVVFYHGGGWVIGDLETHDTLCRILCAQAGVLVISVAYRRAPEHPYPIPLDDCCDALTYCIEHASELGLDLARLAVAGDSAGEIWQQPRP